MEKQSRVKEEAGHVGEIQAERWFYSFQKDVSNLMVERLTTSFTKIGEFRGKNKQTNKPLQGLGGGKQGEISGPWERP